MPFIPSSDEFSYDLSSKQFIEEKALNIDDITAQINGVLDASLAKVAVNGITKQYIDVAVANLAATIQYADWNKAYIHSTDKDGVVAGVGHTDLTDHVADVTTNPHHVTLPEVLTKGNIANMVIDMNNNKITNVTIPTSSLDAANKTYVDTQIAAQVVTPAYVSGYLNGVFGYIYTRYINITNWNMQTTLVKVVNVVLNAGESFYGMEAFIVNDTNTYLYPLTRPTAGISQGWIANYNANTGDITMSVLPAGDFQVADFSGTGLRGWIIINYRKTLP